MRRILLVILGIGVGASLLGAAGCHAAVRYDVPVHGYGYCEAPPPPPPVSAGIYYGYGPVWPRYHAYRPYGGGVVYGPSVHIGAGWYRGHRPWGAHRR